MFKVLFAASVLFVLSHNSGAFAGPCEEGNGAKCPKETQQKSEEKPCKSHWNGGNWETGGRLVSEEGACLYKTVMRNARPKHSEATTQETSPQTESEPTSQGPSSNSRLYNKNAEMDTSSPAPSSDSSESEPSRQKPEGGG